jgi:hypothetical protein
MDLAFVQHQPILVTVDEASSCILAYDLKGSKGQHHLIVAETKLIAAYRSFGHLIRTILTDSESALLSTAVFLNSNGIQLLHALPGRHCSMAERAIRSVKDRARAALSMLSYNLPSSCHIALFLDAASCCNLLPTVATGGSSPRELFTGVKLNASLHLRAAFGEYVLVKTPWTSSKPPDHLPRAEGALVVGRDFQSPGGIKAFLLASRQILSRDSFTRAVLTTDIVRQINSIASSSAEPPSPELTADDPVPDQDSDTSRGASCVVPRPSFFSSVVPTNPDA